METTTLPIQGVKFNRKDFIKEVTAVRDLLLKNDPGRFDVDN